MFMIQYPETVYKSFDHCLASRNLFHVHLEHPPKKSAMSTLYWDFPFLSNVAFDTLIKT